MFKLIAQGCLGVALFLLSSVPASAAVVYDLNLPANGNVDPIRIQVTLPTYLAGSLTVFDVNDPEVTEFSAGGIPITLGVIGIEVLPSVTLVGVALADDLNRFATLNRDFPDDFFAFTRLVHQNGSFSSVSGTIEAELPYVLDSPTPTAQLDVSAAAIPEPASVFTFGAGGIALCFLARRRRRTIALKTE